MKKYQRLIPGASIINWKARSGKVSISRIMVISLVVDGIAIEARLQ
jgi:hypothetical protein